VDDEFVTPLQPAVCPICGSPDVAPLQYGMPSDAVFEAAARGEVVIAGCVIREETDGCRACGAHWVEWIDWNARPLG
jgi:hypothetical protein